MNWTKSLLVTAGLTACLGVPLGAWADEAAAEHHETIAEMGKPFINAALWQQTAAERKALCYQTYNVATKVIAQRIDEGNYTKRDGRLYENAWVPNGDGTYTLYSRPLAIILDLDETVIDNSEYECWMTLHPSKEAFFGVRRFFEYQAQQEHPQAIPGAVEFLNKCREWGVTPLYVTDRDEAEFNDMCLSTLRHMGLGSPTLEQELYCRNRERDAANAQAIIKALNLKADDPLALELTQNASNKSVRRWMLGTKYKVLAFFGDDLYDLPVMVDKSARDAEARKQRDEQVHSQNRHLGCDWFVLPNPLYGSWKEKSGFPLTDNDNAIRALKEATAPYERWLQEHQEQSK